MIKLINPRGVEIYVHESRLDEYLARGCKFYEPPPPVAPRGQNPTPAKKTAKKAR